jgi:hypothetical protein
MSRGIGKTQRQILAWLSQSKPEPLTVKVLTRAISHKLTGRTGLTCLVRVFGTREGVE